MSDKKKERPEPEKLTGEEITELYNRIYGPMGGEDPETREFRQEAARRTFERSEWEE